MGKVMVVVAGVVVGKLDKWMRRAVFGKRSFRVNLGITI
jgi:hypothetical protein